MAHIELNDRFENGHVSALASTLVRVSQQWLAARAARLHERRQQKLDRDAFRTLVGREDWVYRDMGVHRGDVEHLAGAPLHVNAARELERLRAHARAGH